MRRIVLSILLVAFAPATLLGQEGKSRLRQELWVDWNGRGALRPGLDLVGQAGWRTHLDGTDLSRFLIRTHLASSDGGIGWVVGLGSFYTLTPQADIVEIRPFQGLRAKWPNGRRFRLDHYLRAEERLTWRTDTGAANAAMRLRYRLQGEVALGGLRAGAAWRLILYGETFRRVLGTTLGLEESSRLGAGVERGAGRLRFRFDTIWQRSDGLLTLASGGDLALDAVYFRLRVFQELRF